MQHHYMDSFRAEFQLVLAPMKLTFNFHKVLPTGHRLLVIEHKEIACKGQIPLASLLVQVSMRICNLRRGAVE